MSDAIYLGIKSVKNDAIVDKKHHGGVNKAVYIYGENHYEYFKDFHPNLDWQYGIFGENVTLSHLEETEIHVGSIYQLGETKIQVTQPREPCFKLGIRFNNPSIIKQFWNSTKCGVYFKVLKEGRINIDDELILLESSFDNPTIAEVYQNKKVPKK